MQLAKPCLDVGVFTQRKDEMLAFYRDEVGLPYEELLPVGGGVQQHRHGLNGSVFKLNHSRDALEDLPAAGYRKLHIARAGLAAPRELVDPDGNALRLVPPGTDGIEAIRIDIAVHDLATHRRFWGEVFGALDIGGDRFSVGTTQIALSSAPGARAAHADAGSGGAAMRGRGFRYLTVQVFDVVQEHARMVAAGAWEGRAPNVLGSVARISFVRDPDGNWIEISQRKSLTGSLD
jgi:lactoylglutathione lyase